MPTWLFCGGFGGKVVLPFVFIDSRPIQTGPVADDNGALSLRILEVRLFWFIISWVHGICNGGCRDVLGRCARMAQGYWFSWVKSVIRRQVADREEKIQNNK